MDADKLQAGIDKIMTRQITDLCDGFQASYKRIGLKYKKWCDDADLEPEPRRTSEMAALFCEEVRDDPAMVTPYPLICGRRKVRHINRSVHVPAHKKHNTKISACACPGPQKSVGLAVLAVPATDDRGRVPAHT